MLALIDGDIIVYSVGFASDRKTYYVAGQPFDNKKEAKEFCDTCDLDYDTSITFTVQEEPLEYTLHSVKKLLESVLEATEATDYRLFLTGHSNFRDKIAVTREYKGNRDVLHKPRHYEEIKKYLINVWDAKVVEGMEADDAMGMHQYSDLINYEYEKDCGDNYTEVWANTIIASLDKDMNMIPGWHYNWRKKEKYWVGEEEAKLNFYKQLLTGDPTDNIQGCPKIGEKTAEKILSTCVTNKDMAEACRETYWTSYYKHGKHSSLEEFFGTIDNIFIEHARLLWIKRTLEEEFPEEIVL
jgi:hypothetical protein